MKIADHIFAARIKIQLKFKEAQ